MICVDLRLVLSLWRLVIAVALALAGSSLAQAGDGPAAPPPAADASPTPAPSPSGSPTPAPQASPQTVTIPRAASAAPPSNESFASRVKDVLRPRRLPAWLALEEEDAPDPPAVRFEGGVLVWPFLRTMIRLGRHNGPRGTAIDNAEDALGLPVSAGSPWLELSVGNEFRVGANFFEIERAGTYHQVSMPIDAQGHRLAAAGDYAKASLRLTQAELFAVYDVLYGARYRIGPIGGAHYTRVVTRLSGVRAIGREIVFRSAAPENDLFSPFFGGHIELDPVERFTVFADVRVVDWAWPAIGLRDQRIFESRLGLSLSLLHGLVGIAADFRFISTFLDTGSSTSRERSEYQLDGIGVGLTASMKY